MKLMQNKVLAVFVVVIAAMLIVLAVVVVKLLEPTADPAALTPSTAPTSTPSASATAAPVQSEQEILDDTVRTTVSLYSELVCTNLAEHPSVNLDDAVEQVLAQYNTVGLSENSRVDMAHRVLIDSSAKSCPDQTERVSELAQE